MDPEVALSSPPIQLCSHGSFGGGGVPGDSVILANSDLSASVSSQKNSVPSLRLWDPLPGSHGIRVPAG